ncbi:endonuclease [Rhodococcus sp. EPR-157]|uniref:DNA/RNA non-specific endonuclease n=1 Tax=Rhodococcus sp. EPR-157 TaxID=1813677 RepID=UPI0007BBE823|nr:DNA/RNA non-specific endonuclease [Rhodococcus sp. EPR-157]KZF07827.1 endonuclease [Rhodococcus sp. EPR-157]
MPVTIDRFTGRVISPAGYDATFLSPIELDAPTRTGLVALPYTHFTVAIDPERLLAASTAVNIDGSQLRDVERGDDWRLDPRLPSAHQAGPELYASNDLDRGHLVRRRDPVWGTATVAEQANADTFHYTVCAPQTATLNQSKTLWLGLEDYVLEHARQYGQRLSVFSGCIFAADDPAYRGVALPRRFFKIAAWSQDSVLAATGYILDQTPSLGPILERPVRTDTATPPLGPYRTFQVPIEDIAAATGLPMDQLVAADRYAPQPAARLDDQRWTELAAYTDIVM